MPQDDRVTTYIEKAQPFAQPILVAMRAAVYRAVPQADETIKWGMPAFTLAGRQFALMAGFKAHVAISIEDGADDAGEGMGNLGKLVSPDDLPPADVLDARLVAAAALAASGPKRKPAAPPKAEIAMPDDLAAALAANPAAAAAFAGFPPGARREYLEWVTSARQAATRARRIETTVAQAAEGKKLHWKYEAC